MRFVLEGDNLLLWKRILSFVESASGDDLNMEALLSPESDPIYLKIQKGNTQAISCRGNRSHHNLTCKDLMFPAVGVLIPILIFFLFSSRPICEVALGLAYSLTVSK